MLTPETACAIDVLAMNTFNCKIETKDHRGSLVLSIESAKRNDNDIKVSIQTNSRVTTDNNIWYFEDKKVMTLIPFKCFDKNLLGSKQTMADVDKNLWQPEALYI